MHAPCTWRRACSVGLLCGAVSPAAALEIVSTAPARYALRVSSTLSQIDVVFDEPPLLPPAAAFRVAGNMSGLHGGVLEVAGNRLRLRGITKVFQPGELVTVNLQRDITTATGHTLAGGRMFAFTIASTRRTPDWSHVTPYNTADIPYFIHGGDLDGDGTPDCAVPNEGTNNVSVFRNVSGNGQFSSHSEFAVGRRPSSIFGEDFDNDGDQDLATADINSSTVTVLRNNGSGTFSLVQSYAAGVQTRQLHGGDFDGDNDVDLCSTGRFSDDIWLFYNRGDGTFGPIVNYTDGILGGPFAIRTGDFDLDGHLDIAVACQDADSLTVLHNSGAGSFTTSGHYAIAGGPWCLNGNDLDGDGDFDLVSVASFSDRVVALYNDGSGKFTFSNNWPTGDFPLGIFCADLDGDGDIDATSSNYGGASVGVYLNDGEGGLLPSATLPLQLSGSYTWAHDLDGDGDLDLSTVDELADKLFVFLNGGTSVDAPEGSATSRSGPAQLNAWPNPLRLGNSLTVQLQSANAPGGAPIDVRIFTIDGRFVRRLGAPSNAAQCRWDGRDARGRAVVVGRYVVSARVAGATLFRSIQVVH